MPVKLKPNHGYYDCTHYPIGGCFRRSGSDGLIIFNVEPMERYKGCDSIGHTRSGDKVAFSIRHIVTPIDTNEK